MVIVEPPLMLCLTTFQLGVLFLPQTLQSVPQFSCTEKNALNRVNGESFLITIVCRAITSESVPVINTPCFYMLIQDGLALDKTIRTKLVTLCWKGDEEEEPSTKTVRLPVPYQLPPQPYGAEG